MLGSIPRTSIAFHYGAYGNYIQWLLYTLLVDNRIVSPFLGQTSHNLDYFSTEILQAGQVSKNHQTVDELMKTKTLKLSLIHPVTGPGMEFIEEVDKISKLVDCVILPYIDHSTYLLGVHNSIFKTFRDKNIWNGSLAYVNRKDLEKGWGVDITADLNTIPRFILREHHSINIFDSWESTCGWFAPAKFSKKNCHYVFICDLFYNFLETIENIKQFLGVEWVRDPVELLSYHQTNVANQQYKNQDHIAKQILQSVADDADFIWDSNSITLYTEAYIQRALQQQGIMLKCNGLNEFPTSTKKLKEIFERVNSTKHGV